MLEKKRKIQPVVRKLSFAEAEEADIEYYAGLSWKQSVKNVEAMRRNLWNTVNGYPQRIKRVFTISKKWQEYDG